MSCSCGDAAHLCSVWLHVCMRVHSLSANMLDVQLQTLGYIGNCMQPQLYVLGCLQQGFQLRVMTSLSCLHKAVCSRGLTCNLRPLPSCLQPYRVPCACMQKLCAELPAQGYLRAGVELCLNSELSCLIQP